MRITIEPGTARGQVTAPPSKSMAHRLLLCAALGQGGMVRGIHPSQDVLATIDCLAALGAEVQMDQQTARVSGASPFSPMKRTACCRESGSTLRFCVPLFLLSGETAVLTGQGRLLERPQAVYQALCREKGLVFEQTGAGITLRGPLTAGEYTLPGDVSSQFVSGLLLALPLLPGDSRIHITPPIESRPYIEMTRQAQAMAAVRSEWRGETDLFIPGGQHYALGDAQVEGDWSNAAFFAALNLLGGAVRVTGLNADSLQGDKRYEPYFAALEQGCPTLDIADCPDLGPVLMAAAAACHGATLTGTRRLRIKESDRGAAMAQELSKLGCVCERTENTIHVPGGCLHPPKEQLLGHNDHRIVMALSVLMTRLGGELAGAEAVRKSFPDYFDRLKTLGIEVTCHED